MSNGASPFIYKAVTCPICNEEHQQHHFRLRVFVETDRESDGHVLQYKWLKDKVHPVQPQYYYLYHCPHCFFTDVTTHFKSPRENTFFPEVKRALNGILDKEKETIAYLAGRVNYSDIGFESALALHYIAAYIQLLLPDDAQDDLKIARLLLRIAWLFREQGPAEGGETKDPVRRDALAAIEAFEGQLQQLNHQWQKAGQPLTAQIEATDRGAASTETNPFRQHRDNIEKLLESQVAEVYRLKTLCKTGAPDAAAGERPAAQGFLATVKSKWPMAPVDEIEAMRMAVGHLDNAVLRDVAFDDPQAHLNGLSLMIDLMIRCSDFDAAFAMVRGIYQNATHARNAFQAELRKPGLDETAKQRVLNRIRGLSRSVEHAGELRRKLLGLLIERDRAIIQKIIDAHAGAPVDQMVAALEQHGIPTSVVGFLKEKGELDPKKTKAT